MPEPIGLDRLVSQMTDIELRDRDDLSTRISGVAYDSRRVCPGNIFCCIRGFNTDGHRFALDAAKAGAAALLVEDWIAGEPAAALPQIRTGKARAAMAGAACAFYRHPSKRMRVAGVTGTNGKTSTAFMVERIFREAGSTTAITGTVETRIAGRTEPVARTTPEAPDLQHLFWRMAVAGVDVVPIEVSSHALELERTTGTQFAAAAFTNLTQDHLDFHMSMDDYYGSKRRLFEAGLAGPAILNADDPWAMRIAEEMSELDVISFSLTAGGGSSLWAEGISIGTGGVAFTLDGIGGRHRIAMNIPARFAVANALAAAGVAFALGATGGQIATGLAAIESIPGRFELVRRGQPFLAVVDYAHTPDAVAAVLRSARALAENDSRVYVVIGCGGDRDRSKRPLMAKAAAAGSDFAVLTSDNPRSEDPEAIIEEMATGLVTGNGDTYAIEPDRRRAIANALGMANSGDVVVVAGKGHETGQIFGDVTHPFDDRGVVFDELGTLGYEAGTA